MATGRTILKKVGRIFLWLLVGIFSLLVIAIIFINLPVGKRVVRNQVQSYLQNKLKTKILIGSIDYSLPEWLKIKNVYIEDQKKDTLLYGGELSVDLHMLKLINGNTDIEKIALHDIRININRSPNDSVFNYQFIIDAFSGNNPSTQNKDTAELKLTMKRLVLDTVVLNFKDQYAGNDFFAGINNLDLTMNKFQPDRMDFRIDELAANGVRYTMNTYTEQQPIDSAVVIDTVTQIAYPLFISAKKLDLRNVDVLIDDKFSGLHYENQVTHLATTNSLFSIGQSKGTTDELLIDSSNFVFSAPKAKGPSTPADSTGGPMPWIFSAGSFRSSQTNFKYDDPNKPQAPGMDFSHLDIKNLNAAIGGFYFSADSTLGTVSQLSFADKSGFRLDSTHLKLKFTGKELAVQDLFVKTPGSLIQRSILVTYDSVAALSNPTAKNSVDVALVNSKIAFNDLFLLAPTLKNSLGGFENQSLAINTELHGTLQRLELPYFQVSGLSGSRLNAKGVLYNLADPDKFAYDLYILQGNFLKRDLAKLMPAENQASLKDLPPQFNVSGHFKGNKNDMVANVKASARDFEFSGTVDLKNISDPAKLTYKANVSNLALDKNMIVGFLPKEALENIELPQKISAAGKLDGNSENITADLNINTSFGAMALKGFVRNMKDPNRASYDLTLNTASFALGKLLKQDSVIGVFSGNIIAKGTGFDYKTMRSNIIADVSAFGYNKYVYKNANIKADFANGDVNSSGSIKDSAITMNYQLTADVRGDYPLVNGFFRVDTIQLKTLNLYPDTLNMSLTANLRSENLRPRHLDASLILDSIRVQSGRDFYKMDTLSLVGSSANGLDSVVLRSDFAQINAGGAFDYDQVGLSLQNYIASYYKLPGYLPPAKKLNDQQLGIEGNIKYSPIVTGFVPGLNYYDDISFKGSYTSANTDSALIFTANMPRVVYGNYAIGNGAIDVNSRNQKLNYELKMDTLTMPGNVLFGTSVSGAAANDSISLTARTQDKAKKDWFALSGTAAVDGERYSFRMQDTLLLNYEQWKVADNNYISYSPTGIIINNLLLTSDTSTISVKSQQLVENSPIDITIDNFDLRSITSLINQDTLFLGGVLDVKANVSDLEKPLPGFTGNASITGLEYMQNPLGDLTASAQKESDNNIAGKLALTGYGNDIEANGNYYPNETENQFTASLNVRKLPMKTIEAVSVGQLRDASGAITGEIKANGKFADPRWQGQLNFDTTKFIVAQLGTPFRIDKQKIVLEYPDISFPRFTILDSLNHELVVDGKVSMPSMQEFGLGLTVKTDDFVFVNARQAINSQVYGYASADVDVAISGSAEAPRVEGDIRVNDDSKLTIVLPSSGYEKNDGKTIVRFIDRDTFQLNPPVVQFEEAQAPEMAFGKFLNYNLNISVSKQASLSILVDPSTGDEIQVKGDANLNAGVDPGGNLILAGTYTLDEGYYDLHYQILNRKFQLIRGSTITFAGPPLNAYVNITAEYIANTNSRDLLGNEVSDVSPALANSFNQKLPFRVILKLTGQLSKPEINFDIELPEENSEILSGDLRSAIENKLQQIRSDPASVNKQVFSLLLLGRFVGEQSSDFFKGNGGDFSMLARQSVSQFLSSALNEIAADMFKGVDIDLNLNSYNDFSNGGNTQRTDLNVAVSRNFADDRIVVSVGQNFGIEGQDAAAKSSGGNSGFKPDITVSYKLTKDGKYLLRAYTKNQFEVTVDGYVMETGLAFLLTMDYERFNQLFRKNKRRAK